MRSVSGCHYAGFVLRDKETEKLTANIHVAVRDVIGRRWRFLITSLLVAAPNYFSGCMH